MLFYISSFRAPGPVALPAFPGPPVVGQERATASGQWVGSGSDVCHFWIRAFSLRCKVLWTSPFLLPQGHAVFWLGFSSSFVLRWIMTKSQFTMDAGKRHEQGMCVMSKPLRPGDSLVLCWSVLRPPLCVHVCVCTCVCAPCMCVSLKRTPRKVEIKIRGQVWV